MSLRPGWAEAAGKASSERATAWPPVDVPPRHRMRREAGADLDSARRGARRGGPQAQLKKKMNRLLGPTEEEG